MRITTLLVAVFLVASCDRTDTGASTAPAATATQATSNGQAEKRTLGDRLATIGGPVTEIAFALGAGERVAVIDASSIFPPEAQSLPRVDYFRKVSAEPILAQKPSAALIIETAAPQAAVDQVADVIPVEKIPNAKNVDEAVARIEHMAALLERESEGKALVDKLRADIKQVEERRAAAKAKPKVLFIYARGANTLMVAGEDTAADVMLKLAGAENAATGFEGFKPLTAEAVVAAAPEVLLIPEKGAASLGGWEGIAKVPGVAQTPAFADKSLVTIDDAALLGFGPRMGAALLEMQAKLGIHGTQ